MDGSRRCHRWRLYCDPRLLDCHDQPASHRPCLRRPAEWGHRVGDNRLPGGDRGNAADEWVAVGHDWAQTDLDLWPGDFHAWFSHVRRVWLARPADRVACSARVGGSLIMAINPALLTGAFEPEERWRALGDASRSHMSETEPKIPACVAACWIAHSLSMCSTFPRPIFSRTLRS